MLINDNGNFQLHIPMLIVAVRCNALTSVVTSAAEVTGHWDAAEVILKEKTTVLIALLRDSLELLDWKPLNASGCLHDLGKEIDDFFIQTEKFRLIYSHFFVCLFVYVFKWAGFEFKNEI